MPDQLWWFLINHPPSWVVAVLVVIFVSHMVKKALHFPADFLIPVMEFFGTVTLGFVVLHGLFAALMGETKDQPIDLVVLAMFVLFVLLSGILYILGYIVQKKIR